MSVVPSSSPILLVGMRVRWFKCDILFSFIMIMMRQQSSLVLNVHEALRMLEAQDNFSVWLAGAAPLLGHLVLCRQEMILCQPLYSMVAAGINASTFKYLALVDYLLHTYPSFGAHFDPIIEFMFVNTFVSYWQQGMGAQIQQLRNLRARWVHKISPQVQYRIRMTILNYVGVDIDQYEPQALKPTSQMSNLPQNFKRKRNERE